MAKYTTSSDVSQCGKQKTKHEKNWIHEQEKSRSTAPKPDKSVQYQPSTEMQITATEVAAHINVQTEICAAL